MNRYDQSRPVGDCRFDGIRRDAASFRIDVDEDRHGAELEDRCGGCDEGKAGHDDFVAQAHSRRSVGNLKGVSAAADGDAAPRAVVGGELPLELIRLRLGRVVAKVTGGA